jgi:hypothetical protein
LFRFYTETASFGVSIEPKQKEDQPKQTETNRNESNMKIFKLLKCRPRCPLSLYTQDPLFQIERFLFQGKNRFSCQITARVHSIATPETVRHEQEIHMQGGKN